MTSLKQLRDEAQKRIDEGAESLVLVMPGPARGETRRLFGRRGPRGEILCENSEHEVVVRFMAAAIIAYLDKL